MIKALLGFPKFLFLHALGLVAAVLTEFEAFSLAVIGVLLGFALGPLVGAAIALSLYIVLRQASALLGGLVQSHRAHAIEVNFLARVIRDNPYFAEKVSE